MNYSKQEVHQIAEKLNTSLTNGLSNANVALRSKDGKNVLPKAKTKSIISVFLGQFLDPIIAILALSILLSFLIGEVIDGIFIVFIIIIDAFVGTIQEWRANKSAESLQALIRVECKVIRDSELELIDSEDLVVGDIVQLETGDKIAADMRIISCTNLSVNEAVLTGESLPVNKFQEVITEEQVKMSYENMLYAGTNISRGRALAIVTSIGKDTEFGKIAGDVLLKDSGDSPLVIRMRKFTKQISIIILVISILLMIILYYKGIEINQVFLFVVALAVSAIPEGLPLALTLALSIASSRMAKKNVIAKKLNAVESLGSCTLIATDKTGTLTYNEQTAKKIIMADGQTYDISGAGYNGNGAVENLDNNKQVKLLIELGVINNEASLYKKDNEWINFGDSIDVAFLSLGYKNNVIPSYKDEVGIKGIIPYESENKYSAVFFGNEKSQCTIKGSLDTVLAHCNKMYEGEKVVGIDKDKIQVYNDSLAEDGYRVIALAIGEIKKVEDKTSYDEKDIPNLTFVGLVGFEDPIREDVKPAIKKCFSAGIKVAMITGDHPLTAYNVARRLNIVVSFDEVATDTELDEVYRLGELKFDEFIATKKVFSRVTPNQKLLIVESYKRQGEFVAVTGDGVNDAPAMKTANIGIAMGSGTDVAKETGTMIITDDNFLSIVVGVEEGRNAYNNIRKVIYLLVSCGLAEILFFFLSILFNIDVPLIAVQLLWLNLVTDGIQDMALSFEKGESWVMKQKPRNPKENVFDNLLISETLISGLYIGIIVFAVWEYLIVNLNMPITQARGYILFLMVFMQNIHALNCRSEKTSILKMPIKNNYFLIFGIVSVIILQVLAIEINFTSSILGVEPLPYINVLLMFLLALPIAIIMEIYKYFRSRKISG